MVNIFEDLMSCDIDQESIKDIDTMNTLQLIKKLKSETKEYPIELMAKIKHQVKFLDNISRAYTKLSSRLISKGILTPNEIEEMIDE